MDKSSAKAATNGSLGEVENLGPRPLKSMISNLILLSLSLLRRLHLLVSKNDRVWGRDSILVTRDRRDSNYNENHFYQ